MKIDKKIFLLILIAFAIISCKKNIIDAELFQKPINSVKSIETRYYNPILLNDKWITGSEIDELYICPKIEYFDKFNNVVLKKLLRDSINQFYSNFYTRTFYFDPITGKESRQITQRDHNSKNYSIVEFERDNLGRLVNLRIKEHGWSPPIDYSPKSIRYDSEGNTIEKQDNIITITRKIHSDKDITVYMKQVIDEDIIDKYYSGITGLISKEIFSIDNQTGNILMKLIENITIKYETLSKKSITYYKYDNFNNVIEKERFKIEQLFPYIRRPEGLSQEEEEEFIKENYYGSNLKYESCYEKYEWKYDINNNLIYENYIEKTNINMEDFPPEFNIRDFNYNIKQSLTSAKSSKTYYEYEYNDKNEWIKRIKYRKIKDMSPFFQANFYQNGQEKQIDEIVIRKIEYFN